ncbi:MAG: MazG nucleotide pyrophosphohydrolase domain-containing protein, partial [Actinomycetota bacterium]
SLARHLIEEAYEVVEVLDLIADGTGSDHEMLWLEEELGDLLFQIVFHAHLASEVGAFNLSGVASHVEAKLIARHPHVFAGEELAEDGAVGQWERIKQAEKQRESVTDGIAPGLPALSLIAKLRSKAAAIGMEQATVHSAMGELQKAISALEVEAGEAQIAALLSAVAQYSAASACDAEAVLRKLASSLRTEILNFEAGAKP